MAESSEQGLDKETGDKFGEDINVVVKVLDVYGNSLTRRYTKNVKQFKVGWESIKPAYQSALRKKINNVKSTMKKIVGVVKELNDNEVTKKVKKSFENYVEFDNNISLDTKKFYSDVVQDVRQVLKSEIVVIKKSFKKKKKFMLKMKDLVRQNTITSEQDLLKVYEKVLKSAVEDVSREIESAHRMIDDNLSRLRHQIDLMLAQNEFQDKYLLEELLRALHVALEHEKGSEYLKTQLQMQHEYMTAACRELTNHYKEMFGEVSEHLDEHVEKFMERLKADETDAGKDANKYFKKTKIAKNIGFEFTSKG